MRSTSPTSAAASSASGTVVLVAAGEIFDLALAGGEFALAGDHGDAEALAVGVLQLLAELFGSG